MTPCGHRGSSMTMIRREALGHRGPALPAPGSHLLGDDPQASLERSAVLPENLFRALPHCLQPGGVPQDAGHFLGQMHPITDLSGASRSKEQASDLQAMIR